MLKKINSILALLTAAAALYHVTAMSLLLLGLTGFDPAFNIVGRALVGVFCVHAFISLLIMFFTGENGFNYQKLNVSTVIQRVSSILLLLFIHFHMKNYFVDGSLVPPGVFGLVTEVLFAVITALHFVPSAEKGLTTLGLNRKPAVIALKAVTVIACVMSVASVCVYFIGAM